MKIPVLRKRIETNSLLEVGNGFIRPSSDDWAEVTQICLGSPAVVEAHEAVRGATRELLGVLQFHLPECPEKIEAMRAVVRAMWSANACIACNHPDNIK